MIAAIDANNVLHKLYKAMGVEAAAKRWPVQLATLCANICNGQKSKVHIAFDGTRGTAWRRELVPEYKGKRDPKPPELLELLSGAALFATEYGYEVYKVDDAEADDVIGAITTRHAGEQVVIVSSDCDLFQLLETGRVNQLKKYGVQRGKLIADYYTAAAFRAEWQIEPAQLPAFKALAGDDTDDLVGVRGVGDVAARAILARFPTLDAAVADQWKLPCDNRQRVAIMNAVRSGELKRLLEVTTLRRDCLDLAYSEGGAWND